MRNNNCNLVVLHHEEVFETRELAIAYLTDYYKPNSLDSEPIVVKYGDTRNPNVILAFGTSNTAPGSYYAIDMAKAEEQIDSLAETVEADSEELEGLAEALDNIITAAGLTVDENRIHNKIYYQPGNIRDAIIGNAKSISEAVDLISNYVQQEIGGGSFNVESTDSINMIYLVDGNTKTLKAEVKISKYGESDDLDFNNNIIGIKTDGIYAASHLKYDDARHQLIFTTSGYKDGVFKDDAIVQRVDLGEHTNVNGAETDTALTEVTHANNEAQVKTNVKLGSTNSIVVRNGGLEANITIDVDASTNKLILTVGNQTITKNLPGVELFESAEYNDANEELIITFRTGSTLVIPIHGIIHTWDTENPQNSPIILTKTVVTGGVDKLSGNIKLRSTDNLIGIENGNLYVSKEEVASAISTSVLEDANAYTDTKFRDAEDDATVKAAEARNEAFEYADEKILEEKQRAQTAETTNANAINTLSGSVQEIQSDIDDMKFVTNSTNTITMTMVKETGADTRVLSSDVKIKTLGGQNANIIKSDSDGIYATVTLSYDKASNVMTFNDGNGDKTFELNNFGIVQDAFYDAETQSIVIIVKKDDESTERITIPVSDLVNTWTVQNDTNSPIILTKTQAEDGDVLSAQVSILDNENNLLVNDNGSLFVDGDSNAHKALFGNEVTTVQGAINLLKEQTDYIAGMKEDIGELQEDNENIKISLASYQTDLDNQKERITNNEEDIDGLQERQQNLEIEIERLRNQVGSFDSRITEASQKANSALESINYVISKIGDMDSSNKTIIERLDNIEHAIEQLIDFGEYPISL